MTISIHSVLASLILFLAVPPQFDLDKALKGLTSDDPEVRRESFIWIGQNRHHKKARPVLLMEQTHWWRKYEKARLKALKELKHSRINLGDLRAFSLFSLDLLATRTPKSPTPISNSGFSAPRRPPEESCAAHHPAPG